MIYNKTIVLYSIILLQSCASTEGRELERNTLLFFDPIYYLNSIQGPCVEKKDIIICDWKVINNEKFHNQ